MLYLTVTLHASHITVKLGRHMICKKPFPYYKREMAYDIFKIDHSDGGIASGNIICSPNTPSFSK